MFQNDKTHDVDYISSKNLRVKNCNQIYHSAFLFIYLMRDVPKKVSILNCMIPFMNLSSSRQKNSLLRSEVYAW